MQNHVFPTDLPIRISQENRMKRRQQRHNPSQQRSEEDVEGKAEEYMQAGEGERALEMVFFKNCYCYCFRRSCVFIY